MSLENMVDHHTFQKTSVRVHQHVPVDDVHDVDVYRPPSNKVPPKYGYPVIFLVHGGAWHVGDKLNCKSQCEALAKKGYVTVAASYRLSGASDYHWETAIGVFMLFMLALAMVTQTYAQMMFVMMLTLIFALLFVVLWLYFPTNAVEHPAHILDIAKSFRWTVDHIDSFQGDSERIYVLGHSAGGHLVSLLATNDHYLEGVGLKTSQIKGVISIGGVYSDRRLMETNVGRKILHNAFGERASYYDAFPIYAVEAHAPPFLLMNAAMDMSLKRHTLDFHYSLRQNGVFVETAYMPQTNHWSIMQGWDADHHHVLDKIIDFLEEAHDYHAQKDS